MKKIVLMFVCMIVILSSCGNVKETVIFSGEESDTEIHGFYLAETSETHLEDKTTENINVQKNEETIVHSVESDSEPKVNGGPELCTIHSIDFHSFTGKMIEYVGEERFNEWLDSCDGKLSGIEGCLYYANISRFIKYFNIPRNVFEELYYGTMDFYFSDYNVGILYGSDEETISQYYASYSDRKEERDKYSSLGEIKIAIFENAMASKNIKMKEFIEMYCEYLTPTVIDMNITGWSIADFVKATGIEKDELQAVIKTAIVREYPGMTVVLDCFDFDYDLLYSRAYELDAVEPDPLTENINEDLMFCRQPLIKAYSSSN